MIFCGLISLMEQRTPCQTYLWKKKQVRLENLPSSEHLKRILKSLWEIHKWQYAPYNTKHFAKLWVYKKHYSANHILISIIKNWKKNLDNNKLVGVVFMDLFLSAFLMIYLLPKWRPVAAVSTFLLFLNSYLRRRKQSVKQSVTELQSSDVFCLLKVQEQLLLIYSDD